MPITFNYLTMNEHIIFQDQTEISLTLGCLNRTTVLKSGFKSSETSYFLPSILYFQLVFADINILSIILFVKKIFP